MKLLFLTSGRRTPATRFRMSPWVDHLRAAGHRCRIAHSFPEKYDYFPRLGFRPSQMLKRLKRRLDLLDARLNNYDAVILERELFNAADWEMERRLRRIAPALVLDIDDGVFLTFPEKFEYLRKESDLIVAGNPLLAQWAAEVNPHVIVVPTCIDTAAYTPVEKRPQAPDRRPVIGWMGTAGNIDYLRTLVEPLKRLAANHRFELRVIATHRGRLDDLALSGVDVVFQTWNPATEVSDLQQFDIGLMPLTEDSWSRYKCGLKLLQYMALGLPAVASPVGVNRQIVTDGVDGYLAEDEDQWYDALVRLLSEPATRGQVGDRARKRVEQAYSIAAHLPRWVEAVSATIARTQDTRTRQS